MNDGGQYFPLLVFQLFLMALFFVFVEYEKPAPGGEEITPPPDFIRRAGSFRFRATESYNIRGFEDIHVMIFIGFGFLMTFLKKYCYSALGLNFLLAALSIQWAILCQNFFHMTGGKIIITKKVLLEADIMSATVLITFGALLGITSCLQMLFIAIVEIALACCHLYLVTNVLKATDVGGSMTIHAFGAYFGIGVSLALKNWKKRPEQAEQTSSWLSRAPPSLAASSYSSDITAMLGTLFLWVYWPSFNSALTVSDYEYQRAVVNTYLSLASTTVVTFFLSVLLTPEHKFDMVHVQNSTLAGGVAAGSICNMMIGPGGALSVGVGAAIISVLGFVYISPALNRVGVMDTCGVNNLHGMPGLYSGFLSALFAYLANADTYKEELNTVFPAGGGFTQSKNQCLALIATIGISLAAGAVTGFLSKLLPSVKEDKYDDQVNWMLPA